MFDQRTIQQNLIPLIELLQTLYSLTCTQEYSEFLLFLGKEVTLLLCLLDQILYRPVIISLTAFLDVLNWLFCISALSPFMSLNNRLLAMQHTRQKLSLKRGGQANE